MHMKPFLILQLRPTDAAADGEYDAFLKHGGMDPTRVRRVRMEKDSLEDIDLDDYNAVIVGGGPSNVSDAEGKKEDYQKRFEARLFPLLREVVEKDFPFLGACYGLGALAHVLGGNVSKEKYSEPVGPATVALTETGERDPLLAGLPSSFRVFLGHKEACQDVPPGAAHLASSKDCPVQMIRVGKNIYGTQFHPELDAEGLCVRIDVYKNAGYFPPEDAEKLKSAARKEAVSVPMEILKRFVKRYDGHR